MNPFCPDEERLSTWMEQKLPVAEDQVVAKHLAACDDCRRAVTLAYLSGQDLPPALDLGGQAHLLRTIEALRGAPSSCATDEQLSLWLKEELSDAERIPVTDHLASCDDCRRTLALTRLAVDVPVAALSPAQEKAALALVLGMTSRSIQFTFWRVAAAAVIVGIATTYLAVQWNIPPVENIPTAAQPPAKESSPVLIVPPWVPGPKPEPAPKATMVVEAPPKPAPAPKVPEPAPEVPAPAPEIPPVETPAPKPSPNVTKVDIMARFSRLPIFESEGGAPTLGKEPLPSMTMVGFGDAIRADKATSLNLAGRAIVSLENQSEINLGQVTATSAFALRIAKGCAFVDTAREDQRWEFWQGEQPLAFERINGRVSVELAEEGIRVMVLAGTVDVTSGTRLDAGSRITVKPNGEVTRDRAEGDVRARKARFDTLRPKTILVLRSRPDVPLKAAARTSDDPNVPDCFEPIHWVGLKLVDPVLHSSGLRAVVKYRSGGTALYFAAEGYYRAVAHKPSGDWVTETWSFKGMQKDMVDLVAGEPLRLFSIGVVQSPGNNATLEVESVEIRRSID